MSRKIVIGVGKKARQGKDWLSLWLAVNCQLPNTRIEIIHFADALKEECKNLKIRYIYNPFLSSPPEAQFGLNGEQIMLTTSDTIDVTEFTITMELAEWVKENAKSVSNGPTETIYELDMSDFNSDERHPELWQYWGTEFRRKLFGDDYWVDRLTEKIAASDANVILIPDTRFKNEYKMIKELDGYTLEVIKLVHTCQKGIIGVNVIFDTSKNLWVGETEDGKPWQSENPIVKPFIAKDRDAKHPSEVDLDDVEFDAKVEAFGGDLVGLARDGELALLRIIAQEYFK